MAELSLHDDFLLYRLGSEDSFSSKKITPSEAERIAEEAGSQLRLVPWLKEHEGIQTSS